MKTDSYIIDVVSLLMILSQIPKRIYYEIYFKTIKIFCYILFFPNSESKLRNVMYIFSKCYFILFHV